MKAGGSDAKRDVGTVWEIFKIIIILINSEQIAKKKMTKFDLMNEMNVRKQYDFTERNPYSQSNIQSVL